jgi:hypothetical protein
MISEHIHAVSGDRIRRDLFYLAKDPLPFRKANYTRPGQEVSSLAEADAYIKDQLSGTGFEVQTTMHPVQAYRCDESKPLHHWYARPEPGDPWYEVTNIEATRLGRTRPDEIIQLVSHKDSMRWIDSPGAHDNCIGAVVNLELARILGTCELARTVRILFCNEEHSPWTSLPAAEAAAARGDKIIAVLNNDSVVGRSDADHAAGRLTHAAGYSTDEGISLATFMAGCAERYGIELDVSVFDKGTINDDDGMFIRAGFRRTVINIGSWPYADAEYHLVGDVPERVSIENAVRSAQLILAATLEIAAAGEAVFTDS